MQKLQGKKFIWIEVILSTAFALMLAYLLNWQTKELIWSLWLSSITVGICMILFAPIASVFKHKSKNIGIIIATAIFGVISSCFILFHFSAFHAGHAIFLNYFFPLAENMEVNGFQDLIKYFWIIFMEYFYFLPLAFWAAKDAFNLKSIPSDGDLIFRPYVNVVKMHIMIFFFAFCMILKADNFFIYAVVYMVFFIPWRRMLKD